MQIRGLHKNIYRLYAYARTQECLDVYRQQYEDCYFFVTMTMFDSWHGTTRGINSSICAMGIATILSDAGRVMSSPTVSS